MSVSRTKLTPAMIATFGTKSDGGTTLTKAELQNLISVAESDGKLGQVDQVVLAAFVGAMWGYNLLSPAAVSFYNDLFASKLLIPIPSSSKEDSWALATKLDSFYPTES